jgi:hypothetical protein
MLLRRVVSWCCVVMEDMRRKVEGCGEWGIDSRPITINWAKLAPAMLIDGIAEYAQLVVGVDVGRVRVEGDAYRCAIVQQLGARFEELEVVLNEEGRRRQWLEMDKVAEVLPDQLGVITQALMSCKM